MEGSGKNCHVGTRQFRISVNDWMWAGVLEKAKRGGLNVIQTYLFWNIHEPIQGQFNFQGEYDLVKFIKMIGDQGMYATLRVGPYIEAEWNHGGFPYWLREIPNITFRTDNLPFKKHMKKFTQMIIKMMKDEKLFAPQGGPIILAQIENEYSYIEPAFKEFGTRYVHWAGNMAVGLHTGVPWMMCKQKDAPDPVINTCNGRKCGDTFTGPNEPYKPSIWTENWTAQNRVFGDPPSQRTVEDIAFYVARFFSKNGTLANYYMYYGGTNFGRTASSFVTTRYYDEAPLDEYGLLREPKWGHLRDLHGALKLCQKALFWGNPSVEKLGEQQEAQIYEKPGTDICAAFLSNNNSRTPATVTFRGHQYYLPQHSISIVPDCKTVVYNTKMIVAQHNSRNFEISEKASKGLNWEMLRESIPTAKDVPVKERSPIELISTTKDTTDYLWYTTSIYLDHTELPFRKEIHSVLQVVSLGHLMHAFINGEYVGSGHGSNIDKSFVFQKLITLKVGTNHISLLGATVGLAVMIYDLPLSFILTVFCIHFQKMPMNHWNILWTWFFVNSLQVGLDGEKLHVFTHKGSHSVNWTEAQRQGPALTWYKAYFDAPEGNEPVVIDMKTMSKGMVWINGKSIGRYWVSYLSPLEQPSQSKYHIPRAYLKPTENLVVILEEIGGNLNGVRILSANRDTVCSYISENHPPQVRSWGREDSHINIISKNPKPAAYLMCHDSKEIAHVDFASYGNPAGVCGSYDLGNCTAPNSQKIVEKHCLGKSRCYVPFEQAIFDKDARLCPGVSKILAIQIQCGYKK
ncbi:beta-galactosidase 13-like [Tripterygium wilfordii]|uniref:Beta-galactosidase n=1 Tax=Tripterygium wilfordii TaxID=458696 RepID=A0A7J7CPD9_TRIWF|nr:beta-galactosidase 13-like [Tripterygium wilfordii]